MAQEAKRLILEVEVLAGTHIAAAAREMIALRQRLGINVATSVNGVRIFVCNDDQTVQSIEDYYHQEEPFAHFPKRPKIFRCDIQACKG